MGLNAEQEQALSEIEEAVAHLSGNPPDISEQVEVLRTGKAPKEADAEMAASK